ncbi:hypothetical protein C2S52_012071 [Perilla frutescens var. hirtella]|nr:hypothetical protein C2S52_012071 [Perilla frutescens var. hirtella]
MLQIPLTHISTQTSISFPVVSRRHAERSPPLVGSCCRILQRLPPALPVMNSAVNNIAEGGKGMNWFYEFEQEVREYELDQFGVVNNAVYSNYGEYGTYKLLDEIGFDADTKLAITEVSIKYFLPLKRKDRFLLKVRIYDYSTTRLFTEDHLVKLPNHETILRGTATLVLLDERLRPSRITPSMISKFNKFLLSHKNI